EINPEIIPTIKPELDEFIEGAVNITNTLSSIIPIFGIVTSLINDIFTIHENARFNKKISRSIINRITTIEPIIKFLKSPSKYNEKFQDSQYQEPFVKFQAILRRVKIFAETVTQLRVYETFWRATVIKKEFIELMKEYDACMTDLNFTMTIVFNEQRRIDNDILMHAITGMIKGDTKVSLYQEICNIKNQLEKSKDSIQQLDPTLLKDSLLNRTSDCRGKLGQIIKKVYKGFIEVACKSRDLEDQRFHHELLILGKLDE
ncbi:9573_t:CDS:2, partial [Racocetra persica]